MFYTLLYSSIKIKYRPMKKHVLGKNSAEEVLLPKITKNTQTDHALWKHHTFLTFLKTYPACGCNVWHSGPCLNRQTLWTSPQSWPCKSTSSSEKAELKPISQPPCDSVITFEEAESRGSVGGNKPAPHASSRKLMLQFYPLAGFRKRTGCRNDGIFESGIRMPIDTVGVQMSVHLTVLKFFLVKLWQLFWLDR